MIELQLSTHAISKPIVLFDGHVLEFFFDELRGGSTRVHIGHITGRGNTASNDIFTIVINI